jgi:peptidoglycan/LPS O-acetylase OafA/YrhL
VGLAGFSGGFVGVDVFFVISGFLITGIIWPEVENGSFSLQNFYARRVRRLFPALFVVLILSSAAAYFLLIPADLVRFGNSVRATVLFFSNFFWHQNARYFAEPAIFNPLLHTWSLAVEEQFYAFWPLILLLVKRLGGTRKLAYIILTLALISLVITQARLRTGFDKDDFFFPWCRAWELLTGAFIAVSPPILKQGKLANALSAGGLAAILAAIVFTTVRPYFPGYLPPFLASVLR